MKVTKPKFLSEAEKRLKKISDILRDKSVVGFKLSVNLYSDDLNEPRTFSLQGNRSADGSWNTCSPTDKRSKLTQSSEALKAKLATIEERVHEYMWQNALGVEWKELECSIVQVLNSGLSIEDLEYRCATPVHALAAISYEAHFCSPVMATVYAKEGARALARSNLDHAIYCVERGLYWSNPEMFLPNPNNRFKARASTGGRGKDLRREPVKDKVAELLIELAPSEGWKSTTNAIEEVANELIATHANFVETCFLKPEALPRTIQDWIQADPVRFAYRIKPKSA
ncbi:hypothetical protein [Massilia sp. BSC265]|uniref:hypothetical protein n=1 Tax=Massilia sp. BSC265 TaxID=1549812 RepID=UPI00126A6284|nr:hypothetical protein [Massilia sp. BSC265]